VVPTPSRGWARSPTVFPPSARTPWSPGRTSGCSDPRAWA
jgi:hypothetical protein